MAQGGTVSALDFANIPVSIILGVLLGIAAGFILYLLFETTNIYLHAFQDANARASEAIASVLDFSRKKKPEKMERKKIEQVRTSKIYRKMDKFLNNGQLMDKVGPGRKRKSVKPLYKRLHGHAIWSE